MQRTLKDFANNVATKWNIEPTKIVRTLRVLPRGLEVEVDDDVIREMAEGQDITMEIVKIDSVKREWDMNVDVVVDSDVGATQNVVHSDNYELRLMF